MRDGRAGNLMDYEAASRFPEVTLFHAGDEHLRLRSEFGAVLGQIEICGPSYEDIHARAQSIRRALLPFPHSRS